MLSAFINLFRKKDTRKVKKIIVSSMPSNLYDLLYEYQCTIANRCYANCAGAVNNYNLAENYVLCFIEDTNGVMYGHAIIKVNGKYYDPTIEKRSKRFRTYWFHSEYTKKELWALLKKLHKGSLSTDANGLSPMLPLALLSSGEVACVEISSL